MRATYWPREKYECILHTRLTHEFLKLGQARSELNKKISFSPLNSEGCSPDVKRMEGRKEGRKEGSAQHFHFPTIADRGSERARTARSKWHVVRLSTARHRLPLLPALINPLRRPLRPIWGICPEESAKDPTGRALKKMAGFPRPFDIH